MKNFKQKSLLSFLLSECGLNKFRVLDKKDILLSFDKRIYVDETELDSMLGTLERQGYIKIKYEDDSVYCLAVLKELETEIKKEEKQVFPYLFLYLFCFLASFLGGLIGSIISAFLV